MGTLNFIGEDYIRLRIGIGKPTYKTEIASYVLSDFNDEEKKHLEKLIKYSSNVALKLIDNDLLTISSRYSIKSIESIK